jgi:hypothetical protein
VALPSKDPTPPSGPTSHEELEGLQEHLPMKRSLVYAAILVSQLERIDTLSLSPIALPACGHVLAELSNQLKARRGLRASGGKGD